MKISTLSSVRWAMALCCAAGTFLLTPSSYARPHHAKVERSREDRGDEKGKKESSKDKNNDSSKDSSPDNGDK